MRAIVVEQPGGPEVMKIGVVPEPALRSGDLLVAVKAAGVNRADLLQRMGRYPPPAGESETIGLEIAGEVVAAAPDADGTGPGQRTYRKGDRVMALLAGGGYAELARVPASQALPIPEHFSFLEAAAIPEAFLTAYLNLIMLGSLKSGDVCVVHAAASGVGTAALQLARGVASVVVATASEAKLPALKEFGATHLLSREATPSRLGEAVREAAGRGADVILDLVGASYFAANLGALGLHGRMVLVATQGGAKTELDIHAMMQKRITLIGSTLRTRTREEKAALCDQFAAHALPKFANRELKAVVARSFPLERAGEAHALLASNQIVGKLILEV